VTAAYAEHGLFDRTHLRLFTRASARAWPEVFALQFVLVGVPAVSGPARPARASR
jgi:hypothetical protein